MESNQVAWAAGVIEGEGCFTIVKNSKAKNGMSAKFVLQMNDKDIVDRLFGLFGLGKVYHRPSRGSSKESWAWTIYKVSELEKLIKLVLPWLGQRRASKANEILEWIHV